MMRSFLKKVIMVVVPIIIALISIFVLTRIVASTDFHAESIKSLDDKKTTVMELTAASTATSAAITLIPGDTATPIAQKLADLSSYFLLVLCAIFLEKYLLTITGYVTFTILIPAACVLFSINVFLHDKALKRLIIKLILFGIAIFSVVPISLKASNLIETTYGSSINSTIESAKQATDEIEESTEEDKNGVVSWIISKVKGGVSSVTTKVQNVLNNFIEAIAVMIVTSCVIPIVVLLFFVWLIKMALGIDINLPKLNRKIRHLENSMRPKREMADENNI